MVATSREGLGVAGERIIAVGSLALPRVDDRPDVVRTTDAVSLFVSRARDVRPLAADDETPSRRSRRCVVASMASRLRSSWRPPVRSRCRWPRSHATSTIASSFSLAGPARPWADTRPCARRSIGASISSTMPSSGYSLVRRCSRAASPSTPRLGVCGSRTMGAIDTLDHVDGLVRRSMLIAEEDATMTRYRMLETIRQYGAERLEADRRRGRDQPCAPRLVHRVRARGRGTAPRPGRRRLGRTHGA